MMHDAMKTTAALLLTLLLASLALLVTARVAPAANLTDRDIRTRSLYVQEVRHIGVIVRGLRADGYPWQSVAVAAHGLRRDIGKEYKAITSPQVRAEIAHRNWLRYGDALGPSVAYLRSHGKSWAEIAQDAAKTGGADILPNGLRLPCLECAP